jgi:putative DNA primase/helicase
VDTNWRAPAELPDLRNVPLIALDIETKDERLAAELGPGWPHRMGHICGVSTAWRTESGIAARYFPIRHPDSQCFDPAQVHQWVRDHIAAGVRFITQNGLYDWGWLRAEAGIVMPDGSQLEEIGALATLVDEDRLSYSLDNLCKWRGLPGKDETLLLEGIEALGLHANKRRKIKPQKYIWALPARYVGPYAEIDAVRTLELYESFDPVLDQEGTRDAYRLECDLLPMVHEMQRRGIRIDSAAAERNRDFLYVKRDALLAELSAKLDARVGLEELNRKTWLVGTFERLGITYPRTKKGNPSFQGGAKGWMAAHPHWLPSLITRINRYHHAGFVFLQSHIIDHIVHGRIHASIHPHRNDGGDSDHGTKSFRFSYSDPPLQQMPSRDEEITPLIRSCFLPEAGHTWAKLDASQQEFRLVVHCAHKLGLAGAAAARDEYVDNPDADIHQYTADTTGLSRGDGKTFNFAKIYGAGVKRLAAQLGRPVEETAQLLEQYDTKMPFIGQLDRRCRDNARARGFIQVYDRRRHFTHYAPAYAEWTKGCGPVEYDEALARTRDPHHPWHGKHIERVKTYTALNALIQGSAAVHTKKWMRDVWREMRFAPLLQMHDCLDCSVVTREQAEQIARLGEEAVKLTVPMPIDRQYGRTWADAGHTWDELCALRAREAAMASRVARLAERLGATRTGSGWSAKCPLHDDQKASLSISEGKNGKLLAFCHAGCDQRDLYRTLAREGGLLRNFTNRKANGHATNGREDEEMDAAKANANRKHAVAIWNASADGNGTRTEIYLRARGITLPVPKALRFNPNLFHQASNRWFPGMVAIVRHGVTGEAMAIHRTFLNGTGTAKAPVEPQKMLLGASRGGVVRLAEPAGRRPLLIGEGIETVLSAMQATGHPGWSALSTSGLRTLALPDDVRDVLILADGDDKGEEAARLAGWRWNGEGRRVRIAHAPQGSDFNDVLMQQAVGTAL